MKAEEMRADYLVSSKTTDWQRGTLGELLPIRYGKSLPERLRDSTGTHPVFGSSGQVGTHSAALTAGPTLIVGRKGNVGAIHYSSEPCWPIDTVYYVEPSDGQNLRYYKYLLDSLNLVKLDKSTAVPGLSRDDYNAVEVVVAPRDQQDNIVAEIEKQFSRLDEAVANLKRVKGNLKRYKAAVLKAAVEGRLVETEAELARREGRSYETGTQLLQRILETRRSQWQGKGKYKEPAAPDAADLPEVPQGWVWASAEQVCGSVRDGTHDTPAYVETGVPLITSKNLTGEGIDFDNVKLISESDHVEISRRSGVESGDILFAMIGTIGNPCEIKTDVQFSIKNVGLFKRNPTFIESAYLCYWLSAPQFDKWLAPRLKGTTQKFAPLGLLREVPVPLQPVQEQQRMVAEVDRRLSLIHETEAQVNANLKRAVHLRQSILTSAFSNNAIRKVVLSK